MKSEHFVLIGRQIAENPGITQRQLAAKAQLSLGLVNGVIKECLSEGLLRQEKDRRPVITEQGRALLEEYRVKNAVILAAGFGSRFIPLTYDTPKGLLEVYGVPMIERQIEQLREKGITEVIIVVGYKKEQFDYLVDKHGVRLVYNPEYAVKNTLASMRCVLEYLDNTYILNSDNWIEHNIFHTYEPESWLACAYADGPTDEWCVKTGAADRITAMSVGGKNAFTLIGPAYFTRAFSRKIKGYIEEYYNRPGTADLFWDHVLMENLRALPIYLNRQTGNVHEFENLDELRMFDTTYEENSRNVIMRFIAKACNAAESDITCIEPVKLGMTNRSFLFTYKNTRYIMRIPWEGTEKMINRQNEYNAYQAIKGLDIGDNIIYFDPESGYKITEFWENARVCDPYNITEVKAGMKRLREFHAMRLTAPHTFDLFERMEFYEKIREGGSCFRDYNKTKENIMKLKAYIDAAPKDWILTHIDPVPDNILFVNKGGNEEIRLIDWEYAGMQDPHVDIAMFTVYAGYDKKHADILIDYYFEDKCEPEVRRKIYAYIAVCGFLWSNWCEYIRCSVGTDFGEYALRQYRYAKDFYRIFTEFERNDNQ